MWEEGQYEALTHDAERCDKSFGQGGSVKRREQASEHTERVFHRLMIEGKVRAAVRWITERERGGLLKAKDVTTVTNVEGQPVEMSVLEALRLNPIPTRGGGGAHCAPPQVHFLKYLKNALSYGLETF